MGVSIVEDEVFLAEFRVWSVIGRLRSSYSAAFAA